MRTKKLVFSLGIILFGLIVFILHMNRYSIYPTVPPLTKAHLPTNSTDGQGKLPSYKELMSGP